MSKERKPRYVSVFAQQRARDEAKKNEPPPEKPKAEKLEKKPKAEKLEKKTPRRRRAKQ